MWLPLGISRAIRYDCMLVTWDVLWTGSRNMETQQGREKSLRVDRLA
jgi:hypothetical protein